MFIKYSKLKKIPEYLKLLKKCGKNVHLKSKNFPNPYELFLRNFLEKRNNPPTKLSLNCGCVLTCLFFYSNWTGRIIQKTGRLVCRRGNCGQFAGAFCYFIS
jgi:hypothetical protein